MALTTQAYGLVKNTLYFCTGPTGSATKLSGRKLTRLFLSQGAIGSPVFHSFTQPFGRSPFLRSVLPFEGRSGRETARFLIRELVHS